MSDERESGQTVYVEAEWQSEGGVYLAGQSIYPPEWDIHDAVPELSSIHERAVDAVLEICSRWIMSDGLADHSYAQVIRDAIAAAGVTP